MLTDFRPCRGRGFERYASKGRIYIVGDCGLREFVPVMAAASAPPALPLAPTRDNFLGAACGVRREPTGTKDKARRRESAIEIKEREGKRGRAGRMQGISACEWLVH